MTPTSGRLRQPLLAAGLLALVTLGLGGAVAMGATPSASPLPAESPAATAEPGLPSPLGTWQYRTELLQWDPLTADWFITYSDDARVDGLTTILNGNGVAGWELVAIYPELTVTTAVDGFAAQDVRRLRVVYKQPVVQDPAA